jgi:hypothetical protein
LALLLDDEDPPPHAVNCNAMASRANTVRQAFMKTLLGCRGRILAASAVLNSVENVELACRILRLSPLKDGGLRPIGRGGPSIGEHFLR